ncbi:hypothetical protein Tco_1528181, partial [Tanacetum coccineum]
ISKDQQQNACSSHGNIDCVNSATEQDELSSFFGIAKLFQNEDTQDVVLN